MEIFHLIFRATIIETTTQEIILTEEIEKLLVTKIIMRIINTEATYRKYIYPLDLVLGGANNMTKKEVVEEADMDMEEDIQEVKREKDKEE